MSTTTNHLTGCCNIVRIQLKTEQLPGLSEVFSGSRKKCTTAACGLDNRLGGDIPLDKETTDLPRKFYWGLEVSVLPYIPLLTLSHCQRTREMPRTVPASEITRLYWSRHCNAFEIVR